MKTVIIFIPLYLLMSLLSAQCPNRDSLWHTIISLRESTTIPPGKQLDSLLGYERKIAQCSYQNDSTHALLLQRIGWLFTSKKDFLRAIQYTRKSVTLIDKPGSKADIDETLAIKCFYNLNLMYDTLHLPTKKEEALDSCISRSLKLHAFYGLGLFALDWKISRLFEVGDYHKCISLTDLGESFVSESDLPADQKEYYSNRFFVSRINSLNFLHQVSKAEKLVKDKITKYQKERTAPILGTLFSLYAEVVKSAKPLEAIRYYKKSFEHNLRIGHTEGCAQALNNIGFTYTSLLGQTQNALPYYFKALNYASAIESLNIYGNIANGHVRSSNYDSAFFYFDRAFGQIDPGFNEETLLKKDKAEAVGSIVEYVAALVLDKADTWLHRFRSSGEKKHLQEALRIYQVADRYFEKLKRSQSEIQSKLFWKTNNRRLSENAIEACYASGNTAMAFYFFERSRSVLLNDQILEQRSMDNVSFAKQAQLKRNVLDYERALAETPVNSKQYGIIQQQLYAARLELEILNKKILEQNRSYTRNSLDSATPTIQQVRSNILNGKKTLLEMFTGDSAVYVLCITPGNEYFKKIDKKRYDSLTSRYISYVAKQDMINKNYAAFLNTSYELYTIIFQGLQLPGKGSLVISPDGKSFPFESLISRFNGQQPVYLLNDYATSYTYSAKYLANQVEENKRKAKGILGIAPVNYGYSIGLAGLPGSDASLLNIKREFKNADNFILKNATKNNFLQHFPDYNIIQLYTHAAGSGAGNDPVIYFADSSLSLADLIADRKPITQLVVLSACETANGMLYEGEGIFSFNRGFAALGIPAAVSNLWSVDNISTYKITELFYKHLEEGFETDVALQKAKLEFIATTDSRENQLPYFWAGTILVGKASTIGKPQRVPWGAVIISGIGVILIIFGAGIFMKNRKAKRPASLFDGQEN